MRRLLCRVRGHRNPPPPLDMIAIVLMPGHRVPCARCGARILPAAMRGAG